jgi:hypothetical protein
MTLSPAEFRHYSLEGIRSVQLSFLDMYEQALTIPTLNFFLPASFL